MRSLPRRITNVPSSMQAAIPPAARCAATRALPPSASVEKSTTSPAVRSPIAYTRSSSALRMACPSRFTTAGIVAFTSASCSSVLMPRSPRWSALTLSTTPTSQSSKPSPARRMPPRAVSSTATSTVGFERMMLAEKGPVMSPSITIRFCR